MEEKSFAISFSLLIMRVRDPEVLTIFDSRLVCICNSNTSLAVRIGHSVRHTLASLLHKDLWLCNAVLSQLKKLSATVFRGETGFKRLVAKRRGLALSDR